MAKEQRLIDANALMDSHWWESLTDDFDKARVKIILMSAPTVDAVPMEDMREFAEDVVYQFGYYGQYNGRLHIGHGGLSTLECAFDILGWDNPHPAPEFECEIEGCHEHATCGAPTSDGYKRMCGRHFREKEN